MTTIGDRVSYSKYFIYVYVIDIDNGTLIYVRKVIDLQDLTVMRTAPSLRAFALLIIDRTSWNRQCFQVAESDWTIGPISRLPASRQELLVIVVVLVLVAVIVIMVVVIVLVIVALVVAAIVDVVLVVDAVPVVVFLLSYCCFLSCCGCRRRCVICFCCIYCFSCFICW